MTPSPELLMALAAALSLDSEEKTAHEARSEPPANVPRYGTEKDALLFAAKLARAAPGDVVVCAAPNGKPDRTGVLCGLEGKGRLNALICQDGVLALLNTSVAMVREVMPLEDYLASQTKDD